MNIKDYDEKIKNVQNLIYEKAREISEYKDRWRKIQ